jgi:hypothetical protein
MQLLLQESGGLRATSPVQSPVPVRVRSRLTPVQRVLLLLVVALLFTSQVLLAVFASASRLVPAAWHGSSLPGPPARSFD